MKECILHIGMHKTGSSSIQDYLYNNRTELRKGLLYADLETANHSGPFSFSFKSDVYKTPYFKKRGLTLDDFERKKHHYRNLILRELQRDYDTIIFSAEDFCGLSEGDLSELKTLLLEYVDSIKVIAYIRDFESFAAFALQQRLKTDFVELSVDNILPNYLNRFEKFERVFGSIKYKPYGREYLIEGDIVSDFCSEVAMTCQRKVQANTSLSSTAVKFLYHYQKSRKQVVISHSQTVKLEQLLTPIEGKKFSLPDSLIQEVLQKGATQIDWMRERLPCLFDTQSQVTENENTNLVDFMSFSAEDQELLMSSETKGELEEIVNRECGLSFKQLINIEPKMTKKKLVIHCGSPKTGSSFIQQSLVEKADVLKQEGILYPGVEKSEFIENANVPINGQLLTRIFRHTKKPYSQLGEEVKTVFEQLLAFDFNTIFISDETLGVLHDSVWPLFQKVSNSLDIDLVVFGYFRKPQTYYPSHWAQIVRKHGEARALHQFIEQVDLPIWRNLIQACESVDTGYLFSYEYEKRNGMMGSVEVVLGLPQGTLSRNIDQKAVVNESLSFAALNALRLINAEYGEEWGVEVDTILTSRAKVKNKHAKPALNKEQIDCVVNRHQKELEQCESVAQKVLL